MQNDGININKLLQVDKLEDKIFMPNEIFNDLKNNIKGGSHISFAYSYYYLSLWLYRYAKYGNIVVDVKMIKDILGISKTNKTVDYLVKKNGTLDQMGYTFTLTDYPFAWNWNDGNIEFDMISELDEDGRRMIMSGRGRNYKIKVPTKGTHRTIESEEDCHEDGTFYDVSDTHCIDWEVFAECMQCRELGSVSFYIYGYLKRKCDIHKKYNSSYEKLADELGMGKSTLMKYMRQMSDTKLVDVKENSCYRIGEDKFKRDANTYTIM